MNITGWGRYPAIETTSLVPKRPGLVTSALEEFTHAFKEEDLIARGLGRSYGDSSLASHTLDTHKLNYFMHFDEQSGQLTCEAGMSFSEILRVLIPQGWFLPVTPGTQFITVGGAIASDVHGKNHHLHGSFSEHLISITLCLANGELIECSATQHRELFLATCGGMGLTGIILFATFKMIKIDSAFIDETTYKTRNLAETLEQFEATHNATYSVAWIDCLAKDDALGRSLLMVGEHAPKTDKNTLNFAYPSKLNMPFDLPSFTLNSLSVKAFNTLYYGKVFNKETNRSVHYAPYFYPLDSIQNWNRMYGKNGFVQYQFVIPKSAGLVGLTQILSEIVDSKRGSFLAVLKVFGQGNDNFLSFPEEGYTLALDFKMDSSLLPFLDRLDEIVLSYGGKLYLTKDSRMSEETFKQSYPKWEIFQEIRHQYGAHLMFNSLQSRRLGL